MDPRRRFFLRGAVRTTAAAELPQPLRPPWALDDEREFQSRCTRCDACITACPRALISRGDGGYPVLGFEKQGCDLCGQCLAACPKNALSRSMAERPIPWHVAVSPRCLAQRQVECRVCADACEPQALRFVLAPGGIALLQTDTSLCNGCGDCVSVCPVGAVEMKRPAACA